LSTRPFAPPGGHRQPEIAWNILFVGRFWTTCFYAIKA
jgi:hypothetical protein